MSYATPEDLLLGDIELSSDVDPQVWLDRAAEEIDQKLSSTYVLPLSGLTATSAALLKRLNAQLATGRLLLMLDGATQDLHAYGNSLVQDALGEIAGLASGMTKLPDAVRVTGAPASTSPMVANKDAYSAVDAFEAAFMRSDVPASMPVYWQPGS